MPPMSHRAHEAIVALLSYIKTACAGNSLARLFELIDVAWWVKTNSELFYSYFFLFEKNMSGSAASTALDDGLTPLFARTSAGAVMTKAASRRLNGHKYFRLSHFL